MDKTQKLILVNTITVLRLIGAFLLIPIFSTFGPALTGLSFLLFIGTDWIDGLLARKLGVSTFLGAMLDGLVDKAFAGISLLLLASIIPSMLIPLTLEVAILLYGVRSIKKGNKAGSSIIGKLKVWILAFCVTLGFLASDYTTVKSSLDFLNLPDLSLLELKKIIAGLTTTLITFETITLGGYVKRDLEECQLKRKNNETLKEQLIRQKEELLKLKENMIAKEEIKQNLVSPEYYQEHKNDDILKLLLKR